MSEMEQRKRKRPRGRPRTRTKDDIRAQRVAANRRYRRKLREKRYRDYKMNVPKELRTLGKPTKVPDAVLQERDYRSRLALTLSMLLLGDPPPGYSAYDRKKERV